MKKALFLLIMIIFSANLAVAAPKHGVQVSGSGNLGYIYYTDNYDLGLGFNLGILTDNAAAKTEKTTLGLFIRKNNKIAKDIYLGFGVSNYWTFGTIGGKNVDQSFTLSPYVILDYHVNERLVLNGGFNIVIYKSEKLAGTRIESYKYLPAFFGLTYLL